MKPEDADRSIRDQYYGLPENVWKLDSKDGVDFEEEFSFDDNYMWMDVSNLLASVTKGRECKFNDDEIMKMAGKDSFNIKPRERNV